LEPELAVAIAVIQAFDVAVMLRCVAFWFHLVAQLKSKVSAVPIGTGAEEFCGWFGGMADTFLLN
jgi:hypothetical protein